MCKYCDGGDECCIWVDPLDGEYYLDVETGKWDDYEDGFVHQREYISYCPYCGRRLKVGKINE